MQLRTLLLLSLLSLASASEEKDAIVGLANAMGSTFIMIGIGYFCTRAEIFPVQQAHGVAEFVGTIVLPPLLFFSVATLDAGSLNWEIIYAVLVTKFSMIALAVCLAMMQGGPASQRWNYAGIYGLFVTLSDDLAIGKPIVSALWADNPDMVSYIYLIVIMQTAIVAPACFTMMEYAVVLKAGEDAQATKQPGTLKIIGKVALGVLKNPLVNVCIFGFIYNAIFGPLFPDVLADTFVTISGTFTYAALYVTGQSVVGRLELVQGRKLGFPLLLLAMKLLLTPIVLRYLAEAFLNVSAEEQDDMNNFAYIYGSIPTSTVVVVIGAQSGANMDMVAAAVVLCMALSAPFMFIFTILFNISNTDTIIDAADLLSDAVTLVGVVCCAIALIATFFMPRWRMYPWTWLVALTAVQMVRGITHYTCKHETRSDDADSMFLYFMVSLARSLSNFMLTGLAVNLLCLCRHGVTAAAAQARFLFAACVGAAVMYTFIFPIAGGTIEDRDSAFGCYYAYGNTQMWAEEVVALLCILISVFCIVKVYNSPTAAQLLDDAEAASAEERGSEPTEATATSRANTFKFIATVLVALSVAGLVVGEFLTLSLINSEDPSGTVAQILLITIILFDGGAFFVSGLLLTTKDFKMVAVAQCRRFAGFVALDRPNPLTFSGRVSLEIDARRSAELREPLVQ